VLLGLALCIVARRAHGQVEAPERLDRGRFTAVFFPTERLLARALLEEAVRRDTFPGLPLPTEHVLLALAPDRRRFRDWIGPDAPEWGAAITFPDSRRIVMQGRYAGADAGDPREVIRHELAHLALHEFLGDLPPRWFDEGYASYAGGEWGRDDALAANVAIALRGTPSFDELDDDLSGGSSRARDAYALAYRAVSDLASLDPANGLSRYFAAWRTTGSMDKAMRSTHGITLDAYEARWRQSVRRRYGALALLSDLSIAGVLLLVLIMPLYVTRRRRERARLASLLAADEAAELAARRDAIEALLRGDDADDSGGDPSGAPQS
jgi:hypothetical protein